MTWAGGGVGSASGALSVLDLGKAAKLLTEVSAVNEFPGLSAIDLVRAEASFLESVRVMVNSQAQVTSLSSSPFGCLVFGEAAQSHARAIWSSAPDRGFQNYSRALSCVRVVPMRVRARVWVHRVTTRGKTSLR